MSGGAGGGASGSTNVALSAKGDLLTFNTASARLPVSATNGFILTTNSGVADGIEWAANTHSSPTQNMSMALGDESTVLAAASTTVPVVTFNMPYGFTLTNVKASSTVAPTGAALLTLDVHAAGTTVLSTKVTIDATEKTSGTAVTQPVVSTSSIADNSLIEIFVDQIDTDNVAAGVKIYLIGNQS